MRVCTLSSGSKGNSTYIETNNHKILIDIGTSSLYIEKNLTALGVNPNDIDILLITHAHIDHVKGIKVFNKKFNPLIYISDNIIKEANLEDMAFKKIEDLNTFNDITITDINLSHDVSDIKGYVITENDESVVYITDTGYIQEKHFDILRNKSIYIFESNHDVEKLMNNPNYPHHTKIRILSDKGHLSNEDSSFYLTKLIGDKTKYVVLAHISEQNNTEDLALNTLKETLKKRNIIFNNIIIAKQNEMTELMEV